MRWIRAAGRGRLAAAVTLVGHSGLGRPAEGADQHSWGPLTLTTAGDLTDYLAPLLDDWNRDHPGERVALVELPDSADEAQMFSEHRSGSGRFDVLNIDVAWTTEFAVAGWTAPLERTEEESRIAFQNSRLRFGRNWPYAYAEASAPGSKVAGRFGAVPLPGLDGPGSSVLGGSNLAVSARSRHAASATDLPAYLTSEAVHHRALTQGAQPSVRAALYEDPALVAAYPYLPTLRQSILSAVPRPKTPRFAQVRLAVPAVGQDLPAQRESPEQAAGRLARELETITGAR
ncbi:hypothetical protein ACFWVU_00145 [Streptomyces sp. NPDC058686]|uniref:hypothetical protein n=1 Tax=Streptomyces sp. NPDC058686 TaxID=3346599 RepID=UPI00365A454A